MDEVDQTDEGNTREPVVTEISAKSQWRTLDRNIEDQYGMVRCRGDLIKNILKLVERIKNRNDGLGSTADAQYWFVQNLIQQKESTHNKDKSNKKGGLLSYLIGGSKTTPTETELRPEDLNLMEKRALASLQKAVLNQESSLHIDICELHSSLTSAFPTVFSTVPESLPHEVISSDDHGNKSSQMIVGSKADNDSLKEVKGTSVDVDSQRKQDKVQKQDKTHVKKKKKTDDFHLENENLNDTLEEKQKLYTHLQEEFKELKTKEFELNLKHKECLKLLDEKDMDLSKMKKDIEKINSENTDLLKEKSKMNSDLNQILKNCSKYQAEKTELNTELTKRNKAYGVLEKQHYDMQQENKKASNEIAEVRGKVADLKSEIEKEKHERESLSRLLKDKEDEISLLQTDISDRKREHDILTEQIDGLQTDAKMKESELQEKDSAIQDIEEKNHQNEIKLQEKQVQITALEEKTRDLKTELQKKDSDFKSMKRLSESQDTELNKRSSIIKTLERKSMEMESELKDKQIAIISLKKNLNSLSLDLETTKRDKKQWKDRNDKLLTNLSTLETERAHLQTNLNDANKQNETMNAELRELRRWKRKYDDELERQRMHKKAILYIPRRGDLVNMVISDLSARLISLFEEAQSGLDFEEVDSVSRIKPNIPVLVFCINASRLGTDVSNALNGVRVSSQVAVIVLHHKEQHALPNQSSERVLTSTEYKSLGGIFDMACLSSKGGIYECDMNSNAIRALFDFIKQRNVQQ